MLSLWQLAPVTVCAVCLLQSEADVESVTTSPGYSVCCVSCSLKQMLSLWQLAPVTVCAVCLLQSEADVESVTTSPGYSVCCVSCSLKQMLESEADVEYKPSQLDACRTAEESAFLPSLCPSSDILQIHLTNAAHYIISADYRWFQKTSTWCLSL